MPKTALSVTLDDANLLWLRGRVTGRKKRSLSEALDEVLTQARQGGAGANPARSVAGTIDIADDDVSLERADAAVRAYFAESAGRPFLVRESPPAAASAPRKRTTDSGPAKPRG